MLACAMLIIPTANVYADREADLREEQAWTSNQLNNTYAQIDQLYYQKQQLQEEINSLDASLVNIMVSIQSLENDIKTKEKDIALTQNNIKKATKAKDKQYKAMKQRIQYLYEKGGDSAWLQMILDSKGMAELLTRAEYAQQMYNYDRKSLEKYANTVNEIAKLEEKYKQDKADLEGMKNEKEAESFNLQSTIDQKRVASADCDNEIVYAQQLANDYIALIQQQQAEIEQLEAERIAAEEVARAEAERLEAEQALNQEETDENVEAVEECEEECAEDDSEYEEPINEYIPETNISGSSVIDYATKFVGNPYVWGGTSLTDGADCSGFVQSVYKNFGVDLPRTSYEQQNSGREVSYSDAQPGDLICYGGHVAIYMGNGQIVHASNSRDGIKISDDAAYRTILSVRRLV